jgi:hypothetical protein
VRNPYTICDLYKNIDLWDENSTEMQGRREARKMKEDKKKVRVTTIEKQ